MRISVDATPLLGARTGVGNYVAHLLTQLPAALDTADEIVATALTLRGFGSLAQALPDGVVAASRPLPARLLREVWMRSDLVDVRLLTGRVDVVHGTNFVLPPARKAGGVVTIHDLAYLRWPQTVAHASLNYARLVPRALARGAHVCAPSHAVAGQVKDAYPVAHERVHVTSLGVDESWARARPLPAYARQALGLPETYLLAVGTLEPRKNLGLLLDAYRLASTRHVDLPPLVLVGGQGWGPHLSGAGLDPSRVVMTGHVDPGSLRGIVSGAQALLFPSLDEGFGLPPVEALACGVPVLASDIPVTREVLGDQASYCAATDIEAFLGAIQGVLTAPAGTSITRRARASRFTWHRCAEATVAAYRAALR